jgi:hypothetical protein
MESPKAVLGVDEKGHALLVTGPPFIYEQILTIVEKLDSPELSESSFVILPLEGRNPQLLAQGLKASLGDKIELTVPQTNGQTQPASTPTGQPANSLGPQQMQQQIDARNNALQQMIQQQMNRGQGGRNRGNQGRGIQNQQRGGQNQGGRGGQEFTPQIRIVPGGG